MKFFEYLDSKGGFYYEVSSVYLHRSWVTANMSDL